MEPFYTEPLPDAYARELLGNEYKSSESYTLISDEQKFVINAKDKNTGEEREVVLNTDDVKAGEPESPYFDKEAPQPYGNLGTLFLCISLVIIVLAVIFAIKI